ncbi:hypothetical protein M0R45_013239 [Rubus argutus]|uniref:Uncharacterized protein n=1 Tax=Rubus argutus TaxID=59490 RepID=A0AAW1XHT4_RUBAR
MANSGRLDCWDAEKMLDLYLHDYMVKKNMHSTAAIFRREAEFIDTAQGFLNEWWTLFYDVYSSRTQLKHQEANAEAPVQAIQRRENEQLRKHPRVPQDLPRVPAPLPTKQKRSRRMPRARKHLQPLQAFCISTFPRILKCRCRGNRNGISFGRTNNMTLSFLECIDPHSHQLELRMQVLSESLQVLSTALQAPNHQQQIETLTEEHQHPPLGDQMMDPPFRQIAEPQHQPDQQQQQLLRERKTASGAGDSHLENMNATEDISVEENTESFLSYEDDSAAGGTSTPFKVSKRRSAGGQKNEERGFNFEEICSLHSSMAKVVCCHFSSNGTLLASAGHEKRLLDENHYNVEFISSCSVYEFVADFIICRQVLIWNMETFDVVKTSEEHSHLITDVRFKPHSTIFATSSFDRTVKIWDAARPSKSISKLEGHTEQVMSVDFHPRKFNLLTSCDSNDEIRLWNVNQSTCTRMFKGASRQVKFQPRFGKYLAAASGNSVNAFDVETASFDLYSKGSGHAKDVLSICWDTSGKYLASVSEDSARIWSTASSGKCIYELQSNGNKFQSCTFHPGYSLLLIIGCYESLELWSPSQAVVKLWK